MLLIVKINDLRIDALQISLANQTFIDGVQWCEMHQTNMPKFAFGQYLSVSETPVVSDGEEKVVYTSIVPISKGKAVFTSSFELITLLNRHGVSYAVGEEYNYV